VVGSDYFVTWGSFSRPCSHLAYLELNRFGSFYEYGFDGQLYPDYSPPGYWGSLGRPRQSSQHYDLVRYGIVKAFFDPAAGVLFPITVPSEKYNAAISLQRMSLEFISLVGPPLGGFLIARYNIGIAFFFDGASFLFSIGLLGWMRLNKPSENPASQPKKGLDVAELMAGFLFVWKERGMLAFTNAFNDAEAVLVPILARNILKLSAVQFGLLGTCAAAGTLSGAFLMSLIGDRIRHRSLVICGGMMLFGFTIIAMGLATEAWHLYLAYFIFGVAFIIPDVVSSTLWLFVIPERLRGRVFSLLGTIAMSLNPLGFLLAGFLGNVYGVRAGLWIGGGAIAALCALIIIYPPARNLDRYAAEEAVDESQNLHLQKNMRSD